MGTFQSTKEILIKPFHYNAKGKLHCAVVVHMDSLGILT